MAMESVRELRSAVLAAVGDELLSGVCREGNCAALAWRLHDAGWRVERIEVVPDDPDLIVGLLRHWVGRTDLLVLSGGLGPTHDDRTREALSAYLDSPLRREDVLYDRIVGRYDGERRAALEYVRSSQSLVPATAQGLYNPEGSALGIAFERRGTRVLSLPGVPSEFAAMVRQELPELFVPSRRWTSVVLAGVSELCAVERVPEVIADPALHVSVLPSFASVELVVRGEPGRVRGAERLIRDRFPDDALPAGCAALQEAVLHEARSRGMTLSCAESCTGGLVQGALTAVPGSSDAFLGGVVAYSDEAKRKVLGVDPEVLTRHGAVSGECARAMAEGVLRLYGTSLAVSVTGIAGPGGGSEEKPTGTVWFAVASVEEGGVRSSAFLRNLRGDRDGVRERAVACALSALWRAAKDTKPGGR